MMKGTKVLSKKDAFFLLFFFLPLLLWILISFVLFLLVLYFIFCLFFISSFFSSWVFLSSALSPILYPSGHSFFFLNCILSLPFFLSFLLFNGLFFFILYLYPFNTLLYSLVLFLLFVFTFVFSLSLFQSFLFLFLFLSVHKLFISSLRGNLIRSTFHLI